jgi:hypothetical protein
MMQPRITVSRRRLVLIIESKESIPGNVPKTLHGELAYADQDETLLRTPPIRALMEANEERCRENSSRVAYACLYNKSVCMALKLLRSVYSHPSRSSVIRWELSIRPRSASSESAAEER